MKHRKKSNKESKKNNTTKNITQMNLGEEIDKFNKFTILLRKNNNETKKIDDSFSS